MKKIMVIAIILLFWQVMFGQNTPDDVNYLRVQWENPTGSAPITNYIAYSFTSIDSTIPSVANVPHTFNSPGNR